MARNLFRWILFLSVFITATTAWAEQPTAAVSSGIGLVVAMQSQNTLESTSDYASYGALQIFDQLGLAKTDIPTSALADSNQLARFRIVINPGTSLPAQYITAVQNFVEQGGVYISGGLDSSLSAAGVAVTASTPAGAPALLGNFTHNGEHKFLTGVHSSGMPVLVPPGSKPFGILQAVDKGSGFGRVTFGAESGVAYVIAPFGKGWFITFGVNPFVSVGYGMGMATEAAEPHYLFATKPDETNKSFNWQTALAIKKAYIDSNKTNLPWGDYYTRLVLHAVQWAYDQAGIPAAWQWYWPNAADMAASLQHDWDSGSGPYAASLRVAEASWGVKSALYALIPSMQSPYELFTWFKNGWEVGLHSDKMPAENAFMAKMKQDIQTIVNKAGIPAAAIKSVAHHYIRFYKATPLWWEQLGFEYDSSWYDMDWKQVFFTGTSRPFYIKSSERILPVLELPSRNEDGVQISNNKEYYLGQVNVPLAKEHIREYIDVVEQMNGHASFNIHPAALDSPTKPLEQERNFVAYIKGFDGFTGKNAWFALPIEVSRWYRARSQVQISEQWDDTVLQVNLATDKVTTELPLAGYTLLAPAKVGAKSVTSVQLDGQPVQFTLISREGREFVEVIFDLKGNHVVRFNYGN